MSTTSEPVSGAYSSKVDFEAVLSIVHPSPITKQMMSNLPDNYDESQSTGNFTLLYGTGYALDTLKNSLLQLQSNNYLYSPYSETANFSVNGINKYYIEFQVAFLAPPLNVSISGASTTDVFIESTSKYGMIINVQTDATDVLEYTATGFAGAATTEDYGDALYNNFGALYGFPRVGNSIINSSYVDFFSNPSQKQTYISVQTVTPVEIINGPLTFDSNGNITGIIPPIIVNPPPQNQQYLTGIISPVTVVSSPEVTHKLTDLNGKLLALLDCSTTTANVSSFYTYNNNNFFKNNPSVYVTGFFSIYEFNPWDQPSYVQEVYRADNVYRRFLSGINKSLSLGPTLPGVANMIESVIAQPYIPHDIWDYSDFRVFKNTTGLDYPKFNSDKAYDQYEGYPVSAPNVELKRVTQSWAPDTLTYNNKPPTVSLEKKIVETVNILNNVTQFDITNELTRQLRLGIDIPTGGIVKWNYQNITTNIPITGSSLYETYNYLFLNNSGDSIEGINLFWYAQQYNSNGPTSYRSFGPLQYGRDYFVIATNTFLLPDGTYDLPSELLNGYNCTSAVPYQNGSTDIYGNTTWQGTALVSNKQLPNTTPALPPIIIQLDLRNISYLNNGNNIATKFPTNEYDFILYSYGLVTTTEATVNGNFPDSAQFNGPFTVASYYDADTSAALQPIDSPYATANNNLPPTALAQASFAKLETNTGYEYITTMVGGQITFNKTVYASNLKTQQAVNGSSNLSSPGIFVIQALQFGTYTSSLSGTLGQVGTNQYRLAGKLDRIISSTQGIRYFEFDYGNFVLLDDNNNPIAIISDYSVIAPGQLDGQLGQQIVITGPVLYTIWDTRIPVTNYRSGSPVFQASDNYNADVVTYTPDIALGNYLNQNYVVIVQGLPAGNQQTLTASWTFNIQPTSASTASETALAFSDVILNTTSGQQLQRGIMSQFTGLALNQNGQDPDLASYSQTYVSPSFTGYFLNYNDYINVAGSKISSYSDNSAINTLTAPITTTLPVSAARLGTTLNFFNPKYGFMSLSILPNMDFYFVNDGGVVNITRPNNNGIALQMEGDTYAGLVFYGTNANTIVDKPTRLIANFTYASAAGAVRKKTLEIEDGGYANWVDGMNPDTVQSGDVFFITGNQFKYPHIGLDQAVNQYNDVYTYSASGTSVQHGNNPQSRYNSGNYYVRTTPISSSINQPVFLTDPSQNAIAALPDKNGEPGPPQRYRRSPIQSPAGVYEDPNTLEIEQGYYNLTPEKIAYIQFDLSTFPVDTIVNESVLEIYFASGFTIKVGKDTDFILNKNKAWQRSRLSGNGKTYSVTLTDPISGAYNVLKPLQNVHWRKNFFEIVIPYAFNSEPIDQDYGIANLFSNTTTNTLPGPANPQPNLEYLGYINIDEIDTASLTASAFIETSVGLANVIISASSIIYQINGILSFQTDTYGNSVLLNNIDNSGNLYSLDGVTVIGNSIIQSNLLPNMKVLIYPYGFNTSNLFFYGYITSLLPAQYIGFQPTDIAIYQAVLNYVQPSYSEYVVKLLESDTYFPYKVFGKETQFIDTIKDIAY